MDQNIVSLYNIGLCITNVPCVMYSDVCLLMFQNVPPHVAPSMKIVIESKGVGVLLSYAYVVVVIHSHDVAGFHLNCFSDVHAILDFNHVRQ